MGATLNKSMDARQAKVGDQVTAKTTEAVQSDGKVVIPKGLDSASVVSGPLLRALPGCFFYRFRKTSKIRLKN